MTTLIAIPLCCIAALALSLGSESLFKASDLPGKPSCDLLAPGAFTAREAHKNTAPDELQQCIYLAGEPPCQSHACAD